MFAEGTLELGQKTSIRDRACQVEVGDQLMLAVDARAKNHVCDLTEIALSITEVQLYLSRMEKAGVRLDRFGDSSERLLEV